MKEYQELKKKKREDAKRIAGDDWESDGYVDDTKPPVFSDDEDDKPKKVVQKGEEGDDAPADNRDEFEKEFDRLNKLYEIENAEDPDDFEVLSIKTKIN